MNNFCKIAITSIVALSLLSGCARQIGAGSYDAAHVGEASETYEGTVVSVRNVMVEPEQLQDNTAGMALGGIAGGLGGSYLGGGSGQLWGALGGAALGATAGALAEQELNTQAGLEYIVKLTNGRILTVVQAPSPAYGVGSRVYVAVSFKGRSRIIGGA
jgi:outer membrane lipoprotein SlyB